MSWELFGAMALGAVIMAIIDIIAAAARVTRHGEAKKAWEDEYASLLDDYQEALRVLDTANTTAIKTNADLQAAKESLARAHHISDYTGPILRNTAAILAKIERIPACASKS